MKKTGCFVLAAKRLFHLVGSFLSVWKLITGLVSITGVGVLLAAQNTMGVGWERAFNLMAMEMGDEWEVLM